MRSGPRTALVRRALREQRGQIVSFGGGLAAVAALYTLMYPSFADSLAGYQMPEGFSAFFGDVNLATARGYLQTEFCSTWTPLLLMLYAILGGTARLAGEEGSGRLELLLTQPVSRRSVFLGQAAALVAGALAVCLLGGAGFAVTVPFLDLGGDVELWELAASPLAGVPIGIFFVGLSLLVGAIAPSRASAGWVMTVVALAAYLVDGIAALISGLEPLRYVSPFYYSDAKRVLTQGLDPWHVAVLLIAALACLVLGVRAFEGREIGVGRWQPGALRGGPR